MEDFGSTIRDARLRQDLSLRQLARAVGISPTYLSHVEVNRVPPPSSEIVVRLAGALKLPPNTLLADAGRWGQHAAQALDGRKELRTVFNYVLAMDDLEVQELIESLEARPASTKHDPGLFG